MDHTGFAEIELGTGDAFEAIIHDCGVTYGALGIFIVFWIMSARHMMVTRGNSPTSCHPCEPQIFSRKVWRVSDTLADCPGRDRAEDLACSRPCTSMHPGHSSYPSDRTKRPLDPGPRLVCVDVDSLLGLDPDPFRTGIIAVSPDPSL